MAYVWPQYINDAVAEAGANGMQVQLLLMGTPPWANGGQSWQWVPNDPIAMRDFATAISKRYPSVKLWMIWGEPNRPNNFAPFTNAKPTGNLSTPQQVAPRNYAELLDAAYAGIKAVDPGDLVVGGNTFMLTMLKQNRVATDVVAYDSAFDASIVRNRNNLTQNTARLDANPCRLDTTLTVPVTITNLTGHKFPTSYPSRRSWLHVKVDDGAGRVVFESGNFEASGEIVGLAR